MFLYLIFGNLFIIICWIITIGIKYQFNFSNLRLDLYATMRQFQNVYVGEWDNMIVLLGDGFKRIIDGWNGNFNFIEITDAISFFKNVGIWFNSIINIIVSFFKLIGGVISTIALYLYHVIRVIIAFSNFLFNPVVIRTNI